jgi:KaiC/GvpD/RAD55 family RecA-like ATPase
VRSVCAHARSLQAAGRSVIFVTADRPYRSLTASLREAGADPDAMFFLDAVSSVDGSGPKERPANAMFLPSPTMLEMLAMRIEQVAARTGPMAHVLLDSLNTLALYNGPLPVQEFSHYLANRLRSSGVPGDFVVRDTQDGRLLHDKVSSFTDRRIEIPSGVP